jgi:hypothetical protein
LSASRRRLAGVVVSVVTIAFSLDFAGIGVLTLPSGVIGVLSMRDLLEGLKLC